MGIITEVLISSRAKKELKNIPRYIIENLAAWIDDVEHLGLNEVRKIAGYHDEPLKGNRKGQRSIRLNRSYRAIYIIKTANTIEFVSVEEVNKHEY